MTGPSFRAYVRRVGEEHGGAPGEPDPPRDVEPVDVVVVLAASDYHADRISFLLDDLLPSAKARPVRHTAVADAELARLRLHDEVALGRTVVAALLFGLDRLPAPLVSGREKTWRSPGKREG